MKYPDLEIYEAARTYLSALKESEEWAVRAREARIATEHWKKDLIKLLHELFDIEETMCLHLEDGELLVCHYDTSEGFVDFSKIQEFSEVSIYSEILDNPSPQSAALDEPRSEHHFSRYSTKPVRISDDEIENSSLPF